jgi:hypothetical protein
LGAAALVSLAQALGLPLPLVVPILVALGFAATTLVVAPAAVVACIPALLPPPQFLKVFAYELALLVAAGALLLIGLRGRRDWLWRVHPVEVGVAALLGWAIFTGLWSRDTWWYAFGIRKMGIGLLALWTAYRLTRFCRPETLHLGIVVGALSLSGAVLVRTMSWSAAGGGTVARVASTDLGWGTSNFIAALLVLMLPTVLLVAIHSRARWERILSWTTLPLIGLVISIAASRGGALLLLLLVLAFIFEGRLSRQRFAVLIGLLAAFAVVLWGPFGPRLMERLTDPRDLGAVVLRLVYFREGVRRLDESLPWGLGLGQGYGHPDHLSTTDPHNYWLVIGPELGVPGLMLWVTALALMWRTGLRLSRSPITRAAGRALLFTIVISQVNSLFEPTFQGLQYHFLYYWIVGAYLGISEVPTSPASATRFDPREASGPAAVRPSSTGRSPSP